MKNSRDSSLRRTSLTRRSILRAGLGGTLASALSIHDGKLRRRVLAVDAATLPARTSSALAYEDVGRELAIQGTGSIAIVTNSSTSTFGGYLAEILRAEGVRDFTVTALSSLNSTIQSGPRAIVLVPSSPTSSNITALQNYVNSGGGLIALRPASGLNTLLGTTSQSGSVSQGYLRITNLETGGGLYDQTIQFHGSSNRYGLNGAQQIAELYSSRTASTGLPAATLNQFGAGKAAMMSFDLAQSVVEIRQGNPAQANQDTDGDGVIRSIDIYRNWTDLERSHVPQADIQQRLFVRLIEAVSGYPTPRLWYFPGTSRSVLVPTGDAHGNPVSYFQSMVTAFNQRGVGITFLVPPASPPAASVSQWMSQGHDFSVHPYVDQGYGSGYSQNLSHFVSEYGFTPATARTHQVRWSGWSTAAEVESQVGIEMDFNSYQWGTWLSNSSGYARGYLNGGGTPMRFASTNGSTLSIYQQHTNLVDEQIAPEVGLAGLSLSAALAASHQTIDECIDQFHTPIVTQFHVDYFNFGDVNPWVLGTADYALQRGATPLTAAQWLAFVKSRTTTNISNVVWASNALSFSVSGGSSNRTVLVPLNHLGAALTNVTRGGTAISYSVLTVDGRSMAAIPATNGNYKATFQADTTAPVISSIVAAPLSDGVTITWTTNEPATSIVAYGLTTSLGSQATAPGLVTAHSVQITGLTPSTLYRYRVTSADASNNSTSSAILTFTTLPPNAPSLTSISPTSGQSGTSHNVTITGGSFVAGATAKLGTTPLQNVSVTNATTIQALVPAALPVGQHALTVTNPDSQSATLNNAFTATAPPPDLASVAPPVVSAGQQITLSGSGFITGASVKIGTISATQTTVTSATTATAQVPVSMTSGTYSVTLTNPDQQSDTLANVLTVSALPTVGHTSAADFSPGTMTDTAVASGGQAGDGAVVLASSGWFDSFDQAGLDPTHWSNGTWLTGGSVATSSGNLTVNGAWARSILAISGGKMSARLAFTSSSWLNLGLSRADDLDNPWFLFGVPGWDTSQVYIRYNFNGGFANIPVPGVLGATHDYGIVHEPGVMRFLIDDEEIHQVAIPTLQPLATWISSGTTSSPLSVESVEIVTYTSQGTYLSPALNAGQNAEWQQILISAPAIPSSSFTARARSSVFGTNWSAWSSSMATFPANLSLPAGRYLQYELSLQGTNGTSSPVITSVSGSYQVAAGQTVGSVIVTPTSATLNAGETQQFSAEVRDTEDNLMPGAPVTWSVVNGGGSINQSGLFTAGSTGGTFTDTIIASSAGITGPASVTVEVAPAPQISEVSPPVALIGDTVTITGLNFVNGAQVHIGPTQADSVVVASTTSVNFVVPSMSDGSYNVTVTNPDGQFSSIQDALTVSSLNWRSHTTVAHFQPGTLTNTAVVQGGTAGDGAVGLTNQGTVDDFNGSTLNGTLWDSGLWDSGGALTVTGGQLTVKGGWVRSTSSFATGTASGRLTFSSTSWQNFGLSRTDELDSPWFLFGVPGWDTSQVYVRFNHSGGQGDVALPGLLGTPHDYTIQIGGGTATFMVDGQQVHQISVATQPNLAIWLSVGSTSGSGTVADSLGSLNYVTSGAFVGQTFDAGQFADWQQIVVDAVLPDGTSRSFRARTSANGTTWSTWSAAMTASPANLSLPEGRYLQYELNLGTTNGAATPLIQAVSAGFLSASAPTPASVTINPPSATLAAGETQQFAAEVLDSNGQPVPGAEVVWSIEAGGGTITAGGLFTAGSTSGTYTNTVKATSGALSAQASVTIEPPAAPTITQVSPSSADVGTLVTVTGANFASGATLKLDTTDAPNPNVVNATTITFSVPQVAAGLYDVVVTNPDQQSAVALDALTVTVPSVPMSVTQSTGTEFGQGTIANTEVTQFGDGEVRLVSSFLDEFVGSSLTSDWTSGLYSGSGSAGVSGGQAAVAQAWIKKAELHGATTITARLIFESNGTPYLNFGFGAPGDLDNPWFLFGIPGFDTTRIHARSNIPGAFYYDQGISGFTLNQPHDYSIRRRAGGVDYLIDGQLVATHTINDPTTTTPLAVWISSGGVGQELRANWFRVDEYPANGTFTSSEIDAGSVVQWESVNGSVTLPTGTSASIRVRTSTSGNTWSNWSTSAAFTGSQTAVTVPDGRYIQYELTLTGAADASPEIDSVILSGSTI